MEKKLTNQRFVGGITLTSSSELATYSSYIPEDQLQKKVHRMVTSMDKGVLSRLTETSPKSASPLSFMEIYSGFQLIV